MTRPAAELSRDDALASANATGAGIRTLMERARAVRDGAWGRRITFSPKVFLPVTNLCRNRCDYCAFRRSPGDDGEWTMTPGDIDTALRRARAVGAVEALLCLGDTPETAFPPYRTTLASFGHSSTVEYLEWAARAALELGLLPHTNAGILSVADMARLRSVNVSLGLMLENVSNRLCKKGEPHHRAPDKRPEIRLRMLREAGRLRIPFTTGILVGIGETRTERVEALLAIRELHEEYGHIQEVIVQNFTPHEGTRMHRVPEPGDDEVAHAVAMARLVLPSDVSVQAPPNLNATRTELLLASGINDFGGISAVTPDYINPDRPWPEVARLADQVSALGFELAPRLPIYDRYAARSEFLGSALAPFAAAARTRMGQVRAATESHGGRDPIRADGAAFS